VIYIYIYGHEFWNGIKVRFSQMKCCCDDLINVNMNVEEACRVRKDDYDCEIWIFMKCGKIDKL